MERKESQAEHVGKKTHSSFTVRSVEVMFPHGKTPFPQQKAMIAKILQAVSERQNGLLESPTGTGKTLAVLCSLLSWLKKVKEDNLLSKAKYDQDVKDRCTCRRMHGQIGYSDGPNEAPSACSIHTGEGHEMPWLMRPRIVFTSRTHSQLNQSVEEMKRLPAELIGSLKMTVLGSRNQFCVNDATLMAAGKKRKWSKSGGSGSKVGNQSLDELCGQHVKDGICVYDRNATVPPTNQVYDLEDLMEHGRKACVCPYFLSKNMLPEAEFIFCPYSYLVDTSIRNALDMDVVLKDAVIVVDEAHNIPDVCKTAVSCEMKLPQLVDVRSNFRSISDFSQSTVREASDCFGTLFESIERVLKRHSETKIYSEQEGLSIIRDEFRMNSLEASRRLSGLRIHFMEGARKQRLEIPDFLIRALDDWLFVLNVIMEEGMRDFRLVVVCEEGRQTTLSFGRGRGRRQPVEKKIAIWCLNPSVGFRPVESIARSIILASGTLSPLDSFAKQLQTEFRHRLSTAHVIDVKKQLWSGVVNGFDHGKEVTLEGTFNHRNQNYYKDGMGNTIVSSLKHIPNGVLCFFPSYSFMNNCIKRWRETGVWDAILAIKPHVITEGSEAINEEGYDAELERYRVAAESTQGAIYFGVYRGRGSEGIDFSDKAARAVYIVGIPYPPMKSPEISLQREYQDKYGNLSGAAWYSQEAFRALNQALGRCIRHKNDFGAIIFLDSRFGNVSIQKQLSKWTHNNICNYNGQYNAAIGSLESFFKEHQSRFLKQEKEREKVKEEHRRAKQRAHKSKKSSKRKRNVYREVMDSGQSEEEEEQQVAKEEEEKKESSDEVSTMNDEQTPTTTIRIMRQKDDEEQTRKESGISEASAICLVSPRKKLATSSNPFASMQFDVDEVLETLDHNKEVISVSSEIVASIDKSCSSCSTMEVKGKVIENVILRLWKDHVENKNHEELLLKLRNHQR